ISQTLVTDNSGRTPFSLLLGEKSAKINFIFLGNDDFVPSETSDYYDVVSLKRIWWLLSPEVLLLVIVLVSIAFFYRWFRGGRLKVEELKEEFKGKE
ncbi:unnamed protein product, partial [marine sediment metagenome]